MYIGKYRNKNRWPRNYKNDGFRTLFQSVVSMENLLTLSSFSKNYKNDFILVGDIAFSYYNKPRCCGENDLKFLIYSQIPNKIKYFDKISDNKFKHKKYGSIITLETIDSLYIDTNVLNYILDNTIISDDIRIPNPDGLIFYKLYEKGWFCDDVITSMLIWCHYNKFPINKNILPSKYKDIIDRYIEEDFIKEMSIDSKVALEFKYVYSNNKYIPTSNEFIFLLDSKTYNQLVYFGNIHNKDISIYEKFGFYINLDKWLSDEIIELNSTFHGYNSFVGFEHLKDYVIDEFKKIDFDIYLKKRKNI